MKKRAKKKASARQKKSSALALSPSSAPPIVPPPPSIMSDATGVFVRVPTVALPLVELARQGGDIVDLGRAFASGIEAFAAALGELSKPRRRRRR